MTFECVARRYRGEGEHARHARCGTGDGILVESREQRRQTVEHRLRRGVLPHLQVGVLHIVRRMQGLRDGRIAQRGLDGSPVAGHGFLPQANTSERVRRHVQRVRCHGCDIGIAPRRTARFSRERRHVVGVDDVMREAGMLRLRFP